MSEYRRGNSVASLTLRWFSSCDHLLLVSIAVKHHLIFPILLLSLPFPQFFLVKKAIVALFIWKQCPFHIAYLTETFCSSICQCVLYAVIAHRFHSVFEMYFVFSLSFCIYVVAATSALESNWKKDTLQLLFSPFGVWYKKLSKCDFSISPILSH